MTVNEILIYFVIGLYGNLPQLAVAAVIFMVHRWIRRMDTNKAFSYSSVMFAGMAVAQLLWQAYAPDYPWGLALLPTVVVATTALVLSSAASAKNLAGDRYLAITLISGISFVAVAMFSDFNEVVWSTLVVWCGCLFVLLSVGLNLKAALGAACKPG